MDTQRLARKREQNRKSRMALGDTKRLVAAAQARLLCVGIATRMTLQSVANAAAKYLGQPQPSSDLARIAACEAMLATRLQRTSVAAPAEQPPFRELRRDPWYAHIPPHRLPKSLREEVGL